MNHARVTPLAAATAGVIAMGLSACTALLPGAGPSPTPAADIDRLAQTACTDMAGTKTASVSAAAAAASASAPALKGDHTRYDVTLPGSGTSRIGFLKFESTAPGSVVVFLSKKVDVKAYDGAGKSVRVESSRLDPAPCEDVKSAQKLDLEAGSYVFEIGPATKSDVAIVIE